jgi:hypothetical protein
MTNLQLIKSIRRSPSRLALLLIPLAICVLGGCTSTQVVTDRKYPPVPVGSVQVLYQEPQRPYETIAFMHRLSGIEHPATGDVATLREDAAELGADAVIVTNTHGMSFYQYAEASLKAIKWTTK